ncbi:hypothetical protein HK102_001565 [Quaeritorhiza haematococci]|nr:hypothetical protein HK102_001565 [Quaeritorhiza haematococci]
MLRQLNKEVEEGALVDISTLNSLRKHAEENTMSLWGVEQVVDSVEAGLDKAIVKGLEVFVETVEKMPLASDRPPPHLLLHNAALSRRSSRSSMRSLESGTTMVDNQSPVRRSLHLNSAADDDSTSDDSSSIDQQPLSPFSKRNSGFSHKFQKHHAHKRRGSTQTPTSTNSTIPPTSPLSPTAVPASLPPAKPRKLEWFKVKSGLDIPADADPAGYDAEGQPLYVARVEYNGGMQLGKAGRHFPEILLPCNGTELALDGVEFEVLTSLEGTRWHEVTNSANGGKVPFGAVFGGYEADGSLCYVARAFVNVPRPSVVNLGGNNNNGGGGGIGALVGGIGALGMRDSVNTLAQLFSTTRRATTCLCPGRVGEHLGGAQVTNAGKEYRPVNPFEVLVMNSD